MQQLYKSSCTISIGAKDPGSVADLVLEASAAAQFLIRDIGGGEVTQTLSVEVSKKGGADFRDLLRSIFILDEVQT